MVSMSFLFVIILLAGCGNPLQEIRAPDIQGSSVVVTKSAASISKWIILDVGEGAATVLLTPKGRAILIDLGRPESRKTILEVLEQQQVSEIAAIFISHYHQDHTGDPPAWIAPIFDYYNLEPGEEMVIDEIDLKVLAAGGRLIDGEVVQDPDENEKSVAVLFRFGDFRYFTSGDLPGGGLDAPYQTRDLESPIAKWLGDINVVHVAHHGSDSSTKEAFLDITMPEVALISVGDGNEYFHPHARLIERLQSRGIEIYQTERGWSKNNKVRVFNDHICILTDGVRYRIKHYSQDFCASEAM